MSSIDLPELIQSEYNKWRRSRDDINSPQDINDEHCKQFAKSIKQTIHNHVNETADIQIRTYGYNTSGYTSYSHAWR